MKKEDIKRHLKPYSIHDKRVTTINHAFASAIAPADPYNQNLVSEAIRFLGQNPDDELRCVFCKKTAETWDHLVGLVKKGEIRGYGHQIGNLVPCCKECNSKKSSKEYSTFIFESDRIEGNRAELFNLILEYQDKYAKEINLDNLKITMKSEYEEYQNIKNEIIELMKKADVLAYKLRKNI